MTENSSRLSKKNLYFQYEMQSGSRINRKCIDGTITGCGNCVGYCQYQKHPGFLTKKIRKEHDCINKQCYHYLPKPQKNKSERPTDFSALLLGLAKQFSKGMDDIRIMNVRQTENGWTIGYITVFGQQSFSEIERAIEAESGLPVIMEKIDYSFERRVELICEAI